LKKFDNVKFKINKKTKKRVLFFLFLFFFSLFVLVSLLVLFSFFLCWIFLLSVLGLCFLIGGLYRKNELQQWLEYNKNETFRGGSNFYQLMLVN